MARRASIRSLEPDFALVASRRISRTADDEIASAAADSVKAAFRKHDLNGDGCIDEEELTALLTAISDKFTPKDVKKLLQSADKSGDGKIDFGEFVDWIFAPSANDGVGLARAVFDYSEPFQTMFDLYDTDRSGVISRASLEECRLIFQSAMRLQCECDDNGDRSNPSEKVPHETKIDLRGSIGFLDFVDCMKQHVPEGMGQPELTSFTTSVAELLRGAFQQACSQEDGYVKEDARVLNHVCDNFRTIVRNCHDARAEKMVGTDTRERNHWTEPPKGFSVDRLKASHMTVKPVSTSVVKDVSWEVLCMPQPGKFIDVENRTWYAEVTRRLLLKTGKVKVENPEYYVFDRETSKWSPSREAEGHFTLLSSGLGLFCLLKTMANFRPKVTWNEVLTALEGGVDMRFITDEQIDIFKKEVIDMALSQLEEDGVFADREASFDKQEYTRKYLQHELAVYPEMVMATLLKLGIVETDPAWEDFIKYEN